jgi:hypothetical protein
VLAPNQGAPRLPKATLRADPVLDHNAARTALSSISEGIIDSAIAEVRGGVGKLYMKKGGYIVPGKRVGGTGDGLSYLGVRARVLV